MEKNAQSLAKSFGRNQQVVKMNTEGLTHEESLRGPAPAGNSMNWVVGHIVAVRNLILGLVGESPIWSESEAAPYERGSMPNPDAARPLDQILADLDRSQERLAKGLERVTAADLARRHMAHIAREKNQIPASTFRGFDLAKLEYKIKSFECTHCPNHCEIKEVTLPDSDPLYYGSRCDRYNLKKNQDPSTQPLPDLFLERQQMLEHYAQLDRPSQTPSALERKTVGIPMCLSSTKHKTYLQVVKYGSITTDELRCDYTTE